MLSQCVLINVLRFFFLAREAALTTVVVKDNSIAFFLCVLQSGEEG